MKERLKNCLPLGLVIINYNDYMSIKYLFSDLKEERNAGSYKEESKNCAIKYYGKLYNVNLNNKQLLLSQVMDLLITYAGDFIE